MRAWAHIRNGLAMATAFVVAMLVLCIPLSASFHTHDSSHGACIGTHVHAHDTDTPQRTSDEPCALCAFYAQFAFGDAVQFSAFSLASTGVPDADYADGLQVGSPATAFVADNTTRGPPVQGRVA